MKNKTSFDTTAQQGRYLLTDIDGVILKNKTITTSETTLNHSIGKDINGWIILKRNTDAIVYETDRNRKNLYLKSDKTVIIDIMII